MWSRSYTPAPPIASHWHCAASNAHTPVVDVVEYEPPCPRHAHHDIATFQHLLKLPWHPDTAASCLAAHGAVLLYGFILLSGSSFIAPFLLASRGHESRDVSCSRTHKMLHADEAFGSGATSGTISSHIPTAASSSCISKVPLLSLSADSITNSTSAISACL